MDTGQLKVLLLTASTDYTAYAFTDGWNPAGFESTKTVSLSLANTPDSLVGIAGTGGTLFALMLVFKPYVLGVIY
jgi:ABC-type Fe3+ transport system permease subunit